MRSENRYLSAEQALHLTVHGASRNEDGTYSWKVRQRLAVRSGPPVDIGAGGADRAVGRDHLPGAAVLGQEELGRRPDRAEPSCSRTRLQVAAFENAGHWLHHDQFDDFMRVVGEFL